LLDVSKNHKIALYIYIGIIYNTPYCWQRSLQNLSHICEIYKCYIDDRHRGNQ